jgi:hypothetical protein
VDFQLSADTSGLAAETRSGQPMIPLENASPGTLLKKCETNSRSRSIVMKTAPGQVAYCDKLPRMFQGSHETGELY